MRRYFAAFIAIAFVVLSVVGQRANASIQQQPPTMSGIVVLGPASRSTQAVSESLAKAWSDALWLARDNASVVGYPWVDPASGTLVLSTIGPTGQSILSQWVAVGAQTKGPKTTTLAAPHVAVQIRSVSRSLAELERIKDDATTLVQAGLTDANAIYETAPDYEHNRVIITVDRPSNALFAALAARYGSDAIVIRVDPDRPQASPTGRNNDSSPFYGGAQITTPSGGSCTSGFAWSSGGTDELVTAGHCSPSGGNYYTPSYVQYIGAVTSASEENYDTGTGTVYMTGQSTYRGDLALIRVTSGRASSAMMYTGPNGSGTASPVKEKWYRSPAFDDRFCTGGYNSGELCGWAVSDVGINVSYPNNEWARNVTKGAKSGSCTIPGDSGGPVYTVRSDSGIAAKGILSGSGSWLGTCYVYFTDIWDAYYGLPGDLKIQ